MMHKSFYLLIILFCFTSYSLQAQDDLLSELEDETVTDNYTTASFKALQIGTLQSTKMAAKKELYFVVSHRFGSLEEGFSEFFGLDNASTKIGFIYGLTDDLTLSASRHTYQKTFEFSAKYKLLRQVDNGFPFSIVGYNTLGINSSLDKDLLPKLDFQDRLTYTNQLLISRKFNDKISGQISPIYIHRNLIDETRENENQFSIGSGGRYKLSKRLTLNAEYVYNFNQPDFFRNPFTIGLDIETGGHVFQLLFSNSQPMTEAGYITNATGEWEKGDVYFGFNLYRVF